MRISALMLCAAAVVLGGCVVKHDPPFSDEVVAASVYQHDGPTKLTLFTMVNNRTGRGAHTSMMINGSQRVIFDPAGSFRQDNIVTRNDIVYNVTPYMADVYTRFHARQTYHVIVQELEVSPNVAEYALQLAFQQGEVPDALCANTTSGILAQLPGINVTQTYYPNRLAEEFGKLPGVTTRKLYEYDDENRFKALEAYDPAKVRANMAANGH